MACSQYIKTPYNARHGRNAKLVSRLTTTVLILVIEHVVLAMLGVTPLIITSISVKAAREDATTLTMPVMQVCMTLFSTASSALKEDSKISKGC
jgi:hypothetical protein